MFKVKAKLDGRDIEVKWDKGRMYGDEETLDKVRSWARMSKEVGPPTGPFTTKDHLKNELSALMLIMKVIDYNTLELIEGKLPQATKLPNGVVG